MKPSASSVTHRRILRFPPLGWILVLALLPCCGEGPKRGAAGKGRTIEALTLRVETLEKQLKSQTARHEEDRELIAKVVDLSTGRLDEVLATLGGSGAKPGASRTDTASRSPAPAGPVAKDTAIQGPAVPVEGADKDPSAARGSAAPGSAGPGSSGPGSAGLGKGSSPASGPGASKDDTGGSGLAEVLVVFLTVSLMGLVIVVVFFPGRIRGAVPRVEYSALGEDSIQDPTLDEEAIAGLQDDLQGLPDVTTGAGPVVPRPTALRTPRPDSAELEAKGAGAVAAGQDDDGDMPVRHELTIPVRDPSEISELAEVLNRFLTTEPYILNQPPAQVALDGDELHLRFYALPTLTSTEHALLDDAVRRLAPSATDDAPDGDGRRRGPAPFGFADPARPGPRLGVG